MMLEKRLCGLVEGGEEGGEEGGLENIWSEFRSSSSFPSLSYSPPLSPPCGGVGGLPYLSTAHVPSPVTPSIRRLLMSYVNILLSEKLPRFSLFAYSSSSSFLLLLLLLLLLLFFFFLFFFFSTAKIRSKWPQNHTNFIICL